MSMYNKLKNLPERQDNRELQDCIEEAVDKLDANIQNEKPIMLLGKIQSGKTRGFIGILAKAFDVGFDIAIVLTKNSKLLTDQTVRRLNKDLKIFVPSEIEIEDIYVFRERVLRPSEMLNKKIFVSKKQVDNIDLLIKCFKDKNPELRNKKVLIIDDEADYGGVGYNKIPGGNDAEMLKTAKKIDTLRDLIYKCSLLQVTATPYSLYLQPKNIVLRNGLYKPLRPSATVLLPIHDKYIGGKFYFEESYDNNSPASHLHITCTDEEIKTLSSKKQDERIVKNVSNTSKLNSFRVAIINFITGVAIRRCQEINENGFKENYPINLLSRFAFIFHIDTGKSKMSWQQILVDKYLSMIKDKFDTGNEQTIKNFFENSYADFKESNIKGNCTVPQFNEVWVQIQRIFEWEDYNTFLINSDEPVINMTDEEGQLQLRTGLNFFIGGQVLDRGITIDNLIGFYYGRSPITSQMDTVLQHARMYGTRKIEDLCVTRFYTSALIKNKLQEIHDIDSALRDAIEMGNLNPGIPGAYEIFVMEKSLGNIIPTNPNKLILSKIVTVKANKRFVPYGFETRKGNALKSKTDRIHDLLIACPGYTTNVGETFKIDLDTFNTVLDTITQSFLSFEQDYEESWDPEFFKVMTKRFCTMYSTNEIDCYVQENRRISRFRSNGEYSNAPDTSSSDGKVAKSVAQSTPCLVLLKQDGLVIDGWSGSEFYWPVLYAPNLTKPIIISNE